MAEDNFKEGVDFEWVNSNVKTKDGYAKTRRFFSKSEKAARLKGETKEPSEIVELPKPKKRTKKKAALRPKARPSRSASSKSGGEENDSGMPSVDTMGNPTGFSRGGAVRGIRKARLY